MSFPAPVGSCEPDFLLWVCHAPALHLCLISQQPRGSPCALADASPLSPLPSLPVAQKAEDDLKREAAEKEQEKVGDWCGHLTESSLRETSCYV